jgi:hypothetical protein
MVYFVISGVHTTAPGLAEKREEREGNRNIFNSDYDGYLEGVDERASDERQKAHLHSDGVPPISASLALPVPIDLG